MNLELLNHRTAEGVVNMPLFVYPDNKTIKCSADNAHVSLSEVLLNLSRDLHEHVLE